MWVDRTGIKVGITEEYSRNSKGTLALVAQVRLPVFFESCVLMGSFRAIDGCFC